MEHVDMSNQGDNEESELTESIDSRNRRERVCGLCNKGFKYHFKRHWSRVHPNQVPFEAPN
jgi:hypothetical protein